MRPLPSFHRFCGQEQIVDNIKAHCVGAKAKGEPLPHTALSGSSGMGKTALASCIAKEMETNFLSFYCSQRTRPCQLTKHLAGIKKADIVFLDEIHALTDTAQEVLYPAIDRMQIPKLDPESNRIIENEWQDIPPFTLVVATDQIGGLKNAFKARLVLQYTLVPYSVREMREIIRNTASDLKILLSEQAITRIAEASRSIPRRSKQLLTSIRICEDNPDTVTITLDIARKRLKALGIDEDNLDGNDRRYLAAVAGGGSFVALQTLSLQLGLDEITLRRDIETYLTRKGLIAIAPRGRFLTAAGKQLVQDRRLA